MTDNLYNITLQLRQIILGTDPSRGDMLFQDIATSDLHKLHLNSFDDII